MHFVTGWNVRKIKTFDRKEYIRRCEEARQEGYELHKFSIKRGILMFWRTRYKAVYRKYYIIDDSKIAYFSKEQIDYIKTGIPKRERR